MNDSSRPNRRRRYFPAHSGVPGSDAGLGAIPSFADQGFDFEFHDEVLRRRAALSAENFLSDLAAALDAREIVEAEGDSRRA